MLKYSVPCGHQSVNIFPRTFAPTIKNEERFMIQSTITINVALDESRVPEEISWSATESTADSERKAKAMMLSFWDGADKTALRVDLWTKQMMVDEMADFFYQTMVTMADTFDRATHQEELVNDMKKFAKDFYTRFRESQLKQNKA
jgi:gliding motility-associated protein GldC